MIESRGWILLALGFVVLLLLLNLSSLEDKAPAPLLGKEFVDKYDYAMSNMETKKYNNQGELISTLKAENLIHFPTKQQIQLTKPELNFSVSNQQWSLKSDTGILSESSQELILSPLVRIKNEFNHNQLSPQQIKQRAINIEIVSLNYNLENQLAYSSNPVKFSSANWLMTGKGLAIDVKNETLEILNKVEATHEKP